MNQNTAKTRSYLELLIVLLAIMVVLPLLEVKSDIINNIILSGFFLLFLLAAMKMTVTKGVAPRKPFFKWLIRGAIILSFTADVAQSVIYSLLGGRKDNSFYLEPISRLSGWDFWLQFLSLVTLIGYAFLTIFLIIMIIRDLFSGNRVQVNKIFGAIVAYLLLGIFWSFLYSIFVLIEPGSIVHGDGSPILSYAEATYFSFVTLCTVGYGDIVPKAHLAMVFANLESVAGQLYLAILVARLVSLYASHGGGNKPGGDAAEEIAGAGKTWYPNQ
ncbi:MAG: ion channel [Candidatus Erginobacter occultus]|nr:ion channel [Candidatus Erginobacter occultus]